MMLFPENQRTISGVDYGNLYNQPSSDLTVVTNNLVFSLKYILWYLLRYFCNNFSCWDACMLNCDAGRQWL